MAHRTLVLLAVLKLALSMPDPHVEVNVDVNVNDVVGTLLAAGNGGSQDTNSQDHLASLGSQSTGLHCLFKHTPYDVGMDIEDACMVLTCMANGLWNYTGVINTNCGVCQAWGDPHYITFDQHTWKTDPGWGNYYYKFNGRLGDYVMTQPHLDLKSRSYGLDSNVNYCYPHGNYLTCVRSIYYYESDLNITITLPSPDLQQCYPTSGDPPPNDSNCAIKLFVNKRFQDIVNSTKTYSGTYGTLLVFKHYHYGNDGHNSKNCMNIVGTQGISMSLCMADHNYYSNLYVWAMPDLKQTPSLLYGLCGTYTGKNQTEYTEQDGTKTTDIDDFVKSWQTTDTPDLRMDNGINITPNLDNCKNTTLRSEIEDQCEDITKDVCKIIPNWNCEVFTASCVFDLCRMPKRDVYALGYTHHMRIHAHLYK